MARKVFIAATGMNSGKTTTSLSLMHMVTKKYLISTDLPLGGANVQCVYLY